MPVPVTITDLSTTAALNYPQGGDSPSVLDDVQRAHGAFIAQLRDVVPVSSGANLAFTGTGNRITGDFSNATVANRVMFQTSTVNGITGVYSIPNGTSTGAQIGVTNSSDANNASYLDLAITSTEARVRAVAAGTGSFLPMTFYAGGAERMRIDTGGNVGIGVAPSYKFDIQTVAGRLGFTDNAGANRINSVNTANNASIALELNALSYKFRVGGTEVMGVDTSGNATFTGTVTAPNLFGQGQTWQSFTVGTQRVSGTTYYNTTGRPILLFAAATYCGSAVTITIVINGVTVTSQQTNTNSVGVTLGGTFVVPAGGSYSANNVSQWSELR